MPNNNYIQKSLKIKDQNITFSDVDPYDTVKGDLTYTTIDAVLTYEPNVAQIVVVLMKIPILLSMVLKNVVLSTIKLLIILLLLI